MIPFMIIIAISIGIVVIMADSSINSPKKLITKPITVGKPKKQPLSFSGQSLQ